MKYSRDLSKPLVPTFGDEPKKKKKTKSAKTATKGSKAVDQGRDKKANY